MDDKKLTEAIVNHRLRMTLQGIYADYPGTADNGQAISDGILQTAVTCYLGGVLKPNVEDALKVVAITQKLRAILEDEKKQLTSHESN